VPFTPSHTVAILPFLRTPLAPAAMALGAMAPDLPYFLPVRIPRSLTHSLEGVLTVDLAVGVVAFVLWLLVLRAPALDYSPAWLRERMAPQARWRVRGVVISGLLVAVAVVLGILTHLLLDLFTHEGGFLSQIAPWTDDRVGPWAAANLVHAAVSVLTTALLVWWVRRWAQRTPRSTRPSRVGEKERVITWIALLALLVVIGAVRWIWGIQVQERQPLNSSLLGVSFFVAASWAGLVALVLALVWRLRKVA
jgi:membrane-bound metal-dependent hydrolase YbcI (DUF457 family)